MHADSTMLRNALRANALFSTLTGLGSLAAATKIGSLMGIAPPLIAQNGVSLLLFAAWLTWISTRPEIPLRQAFTVAVLDSLWVVGSVVILAGNLGNLTSGGKWIVGVIALIVATLADLQFLGLWKMRRAREAAA